jgi:hypothetical protein
LYAVALLATYVCSARESFKDCFASADPEQVHLWGGAYLCNAPKSCPWPQVARSQEESIVSRFEADVVSVLADTLTQAGTAARWERDGIGAQELAMHLLDTSAGVKSATGNLSDYKRRMALAI